ncbi:hypothetical protein [Paenibacillus sp. NPDC058177]|uniref:hypothetical protein n=1 Tax=Paenibacillus sp. NPDC058177 TaxID=3346369 RepID=UPI0036D845D2
MLIELSGIDGSGKSTQMDKLFRFFNESGIPSYQRTLRSTYKRILATISQENGHKHWSTYYTPDEVEVAHALEMINLVFTSINPVNHNKQIIITDTYTLRWIATAILWDSKDISKISKIFNNIPQPYLSFHLETSISEANQRILNREKGDHILSFGNVKKLEKYQESFNQAKQVVDYKCISISTDQSIEETFNELKSNLLTQIKLDSEYKWMQEKIGIL